jgi:MFS family permease
MSLAAGRSVRRLMTDRQIRRLEIAFAGFNAAEFGTWTAMIIYAYGQGGATAAALVAVAQLVPAALFAPLAAGFADRRGAALALRLGYVAQAVTMTVATAAMWLRAPAGAVYGAAILVAVAVTLTRPAQAALLPQLVDQEQLGVANAVSGWVESVSFMSGPALAGLLVAVHGPAAAFGFFAAIITACCFAVAPLGARSPTVLTPVAQDAEHPSDASRLAGFAAVRADPDVLRLVLVLVAQYGAMGALDVLGVSLSETKIGLGPAGAGYLNAAFGAGGVIGALVIISPLGRAPMRLTIATAGLLWGVAYVFCGIVPAAGFAFLVFSVSGGSRTALDVVGRTMLQQTAPPAVLARVFGVVEGASMLGLGAGALSVPLLLSSGGLRLAFITSGVLVVVLVLLPLLPIKAPSRTPSPGPLLADRAPVA